VVVNDPAVLPSVVRRLDDAGVLIAELSLRGASLDEVFLALTGHPAEEDEPDVDEPDDRPGKAKGRPAGGAKDDVLTGVSGEGTDQKGTRR
jgi:oleandomycin transport system ATP-binding protein